MDSAHRSTDAQLNRTERQLNKLYNKLHRDIVNDIAPYWDDLLIDDEEATQGQRKRYADRNGTLDAVIALVVARIVSANEHATNIINSGIGGVYSTNYDYWAQVFYRDYNVVIPDKQKLIEQMQNRYDKRAYDHATDFKYVSEDVKKAIVDGIKQGAAPKGIEKRIKNVGEGHSRRSLKTTARTETTRFQAAGRMDAGNELKNLGAVVEKCWVAFIDSVTRDTHEHQNELEEWVPIDEPFSNGMQYPGDSNDPAEVCNCRCTVIFRVAGWR